MCDENRRGWLWRMGDRGVTHCSVFSSCYTHIGPTTLSITLRNTNMPLSTAPSNHLLANDPFAHLKTPEQINAFAKQLTKGLRYTGTPPPKRHARGGHGPSPINHHDPTVLRKTLHSLRTVDDINRYVSTILADYQIDPTSSVDTRPLAQTRSGQMRSRETGSRETGSRRSTRLVAGGGRRRRRGGGSRRRGGWYTFRIV